VHGEACSHQCLPAHQVGALAGFQAARTLVVWRTGLTWRRHKSEPRLQFADGVPALPRTWPQTEGIPCTRTPMLPGVHGDPRTARIRACATNAFSDGICLHRDVWSWKSLRAIRRLLLRLHSARRHFVLQNMPKRSKIRERKVKEMWERAA
jgi:hypothetical protein